MDQPETKPKRAVKTFFDGRATIVSKIKLSLTARDWQLYDLPGKAAAARSLNKSVAAALNTGDVNAAYKALSTQSKFGAADSEGYGVVERLARKMGLET